MEQRKHQSISLDEFKELLEHEQQQLIHDLRELRQYIELSEHEPDPNDVATVEEIRSNSLQRLEHATKQLHAVEEALIRIHNGTYGICEDSGEPINPERLRANPTTKYSIQAQTIRDELKRDF